ncbi:YbbR-like domain-containing protein [bacterium LRH843]|nr:YbbR-like domain-containing protein [bacterium LRH843]
MDKLFNNHWFIKIISFFIALMLFAVVNLDNISSKPGVLPQLSPANYTIDEVDVKVIYDEENYAIIDQTEHVKVNLKGPQSDITMFQLKKPSYEVFVDVTDREEGAHTLSVQHRGFPNELTVSIVPQFVRVELQEKQTVSLPIQVELENVNEVEEGYTVGTPIVTPVNVEVTAARSFVANVATAKVYVDVAGADKMLEKAVPVVLYDKRGQEIDLPVNPTVVDVRVPITSPNRVVPLKIKRVGALVEGLSIQDVRVDPAEVTIYGPTEIIKGINVVEAGELNLDEIIEDGSYEMQVPIPSGVEKVSPETVNVTVIIGNEEKKELVDVPIEVIGNGEGQTVTFTDKKEKAITLTAKGTNALLEKLTLADIQAFIDISGLFAGDHIVPVEINGPANIRFNPEELTISITISNDAIEGANE